MLRNFFSFLFIASTLVYGLGCNQPDFQATVAAEVSRQLTVVAPAPTERPAIVAVAPSPIPKITCDQMVAFELASGIKLEERLPVYLQAKAFLVVEGSFTGGGVLEVSLRQLPNYSPQFFQGQTVNSPFQVTFIAENIGLYELIFQSIHPVQTRDNRPTPTPKRITARYKCLL